MAEIKSPWGPVHLFVNADGTITVTSGDLTISGVAYEARHTYQWFESAVAWRRRSSYSYLRRRDWLDTGKQQPTALALHTWGEWLEDVVPRWAAGHFQAAHDVALEERRARQRERLAERFANAAELVARLEADLECANAHPERMVLDEGDLVGLPDGTSATVMDGSPSTGYRVNRRPGAVLPREGVERYAWDQLEWEGAN